MGLLGILAGLSLLIWLAFRGWSVLLLAPAAALLAALFGGEPLLASWTQIFMDSAARFLAQLFPLFLLGARVYGGGFYFPPVNAKLRRPRRKFVRFGR